ncbi:MAG: PAS domain S-box protein, partial [Chloroflexota bacterium]
MKERAITVLIVDDDPGLQVSLGDILKVKGFEPIPVKTGKAALAQVERKEIDVALIDLRLEDMPGLDVMRAIKQHSPDTECILLTGHATQDSAIEAINLGAYSYYQKPFNIDQLILSIRHAGERRVASRALTESEARYRGLFEDSPVSLWEEDFSAVKKRLDGLRKRGVKDFRAYLKSHPQVVKECAALVQILDVNKTTLELYRAESKEDLLKNLATVLCDESYEQYREELVYIAEGRTHFSWEGINQTVDGRRLDVSIYWSAAPGYENDLAKVIVSIEDITQRKQAQNALRASETRYRTLAETSQDMIFIITRDGYIDYVNQFAASQFDRQPEKLIGKRPTDLFPPEVSKRQQKNLRKVFQSGEPVYTEEPTLFGKREIWLGTWLIPLDKDEAGRVKSVMGVSRDMSERKRAEAELKANEERFRALVERSLDVITLLDADGKVLYHSPAYSRLMGRSVEERLGKSVFDYIHPDDRKRAQADLKNLLAGARRTVEVAARLQHTDGTWRWIEGTAINLLHEPAVQAIVINYRDVTERKQAEESRREAELRYRALFEQSHDAVFILDLHGRHLAVNPHAAEMLGYTPEEMLRLSFRDISAQVPQSEKTMRRLLRGEHIPLYERTFRKKTGELV